MIRKTIEILICMLLAILIITLHLIYEQYIDSIYNGNKGYLFISGLKVHGSFFIDLTIWIMIILIFQLVILIMIENKE